MELHTRYGPGDKKDVICVRKPRASAVNTAVPAVVLAVRSTCATPFVSVVTVTLPPLSALVVAVPVPERLCETRTVGDAESTPAFVAKATGTPAMGVPDPLAT
jgi:hypothetical protein